jgi:hypothetical protein
MRNYVHEVVESVRSPKPIITWEEREVEEEKGMRGLGDLSYLSSLPVFSAKAVECLGSLLTANGQLLPVKQGRNTWFVFQTTRVIDALDAARSQLAYEGDIFSDHKHVFREEALISATLFRTPESLWNSFPFVTDEFVARIKEAKLLGFSFKLLWSSTGQVHEKYVPPKGLLSFQELEQALRKKYKGQGLPECFLKKNSKERASRALARLERKLQRTLPRAFKEVWCQYDLGKWGGLDASFDPLHEIWKGNQEQEYPWWGERKAPNDLLMIGMVDPYTFLLHMKTGRLLAIDEDTPPAKALHIASDFEKFVLGTGTLDVCSRIGKSNRKLGGNIAEWTGGTAGKAFWIELAENQGV